MVLIQEDKSACEALPGCRHLPEFRCEDIPQQLFSFVLMGRGFIIRFYKEIRVDAVDGDCFFEFPTLL